MSEDDDIDIDYGLTDAPRVIRDEWSRRTWYGKMHVVVWEAAGIIILLTLISILKSLVYVVEGIEENCPSKYKDAEAADQGCDNG